MTSTLLFFGLPSLYILSRNIGILRKSLIASLLLGTIFYIVLDPLATINGAWLITGTIFPFKFLGIATIENYIYALLWVLSAVLFYEHFFDKGRRADKIASAVRYFLYPFATLALFIIVIFYVKPNWLVIPYFYVLGGFALSIVPLCLFLYYFPVFWKRYLIIGIYFSFLLFLFEIAALKNNHWMFPGKDFIGFVDFFGYRFPIEELFIWIITATPGLLAYYEFFMDDRKLSN